MIKTSRNWKSHQPKNITRGSADLLLAPAVASAQHCWLLGCASNSVPRPMATPPRYTLALQLCGLVVTSFYEHLSVSPSVGQTHDRLMIRPWLWAKTVSGKVVKAFTGPGLSIRAQMVVGTCP